MFEDLQHLVTCLKTSSRVLGIVRYGSRRVDDASPGGDFDLFVIVDERPSDLEGIHFYVGDIPVDLNLRTLADLRRDAPLMPFDRALAKGEMLHDRDGTLTAEVNAAVERWSTAPSGLSV